MKLHCQIVNAFISPNFMKQNVLFFVPTSFIDTHRHTILYYYLVLNLILTTKDKLDEIFLRLELLAVLNKLQDQ